VKAYAVGVGRARSTVHDEVYAAEVAEAVPDIRNSLSRHFAKLVEIHAAPAWLWPALVAAMLPSTRPVIGANPYHDDRGCSTFAAGCAKTESFRFSRTRPVRPTRRRGARFRVAG
jgi:hypothetical protein